MAEDRELEEGYALHAVVIGPEAEEYILELLGGYSKEGVYIL